MSLWLLVASRVKRRFCLWRIVLARLVFPLRSPDPMSVAAEEAFLATLVDSEQEWGMFHMLVAQAVLQRPVQLAEPVEGERRWHLQSINEIVLNYVREAGAEVRPAPDGPPLRLLPTRMLKISVGLEAMTHWDPLLEVPLEHASMSVEEYRAFVYQASLQQEERAPQWAGLVEQTSVAYGGEQRKSALVARERADMEHRCRKWATQALELRDELNLQPAHVEGDGACALASLCVARSGQASVSAVDTRSLRDEVQQGAALVLQDPRLRSLYLLLEGRDQEVAPCCQAGPLPELLLGTLQASCAAYTLRGPQLALAKLRGYKKYENRFWKLSPGYAGCDDIATEHSSILGLSWPSAPPEDSLPKSAVYGIVLHGAAKDAASLSDPWALGPLCHSVLLSVDLHLR